MRHRFAMAAVALALVVPVGSTSAGEWPAWRGPNADGVSGETGLPSTWSTGGDNLAWHAPFVGRSTPVAIDGQVCVIGRTDEEKITRQEIVACFDARTGAKRWEYRFNVYHTTVPYNRVGWASLVADPETGNVYAHGVQGMLLAFDHDGRLLWKNFTTETLGQIGGYGGRTQTPLIDGDLLILSFVSSGWAEQGAPRHRYYAFDKRTGEQVWVAAPGGFPADMNTQAQPVVATLGGVRTLVAPDADGSVYGLDLRDGSTRWTFRFGKRGLNSTPVVSGDVVFIGHSEENLDTPDMGRLVAFSAKGTGDITATAEVWRINQLSVGFPSPAFHDGTLYVIDNSANLYAVDAATGTVRWEFSLGTVGKASPVIADGKIYATETNGHVVILKPGKDACTELDRDQIEVPGGRYAEIYGSPAIAYGRVFVSTEAGLFAIAQNGRYDGPDPAKPPKKAPPANPAAGEIAAIQAVPMEIAAEPGKPVALHVRAVDANALPVAPPSEATWTLEGLKGTIDGGTFVPDPAVPFQVGKITVAAGGKTAVARVRVIGPFPWSIDFENVPVGKVPPTWISAGGGKFVVQERDGGKVLVQAVREKGLQRSYTFFGRTDDADYTFAMDFQAGQTKRRRPDVGMMAGGYTLDLKGVAQELEVRSWTSELRMAKAVPFAWEMDTWYTMKMSVTVDGAKGTIRGKVWKRGEPEPEDWTIVAEDPIATPSGGPGIVGYAPAEILYDNLTITRN